MRLRRIGTLCLALAGGLALAQPASAQSSACILGEVRWFAGNFEPQSWRFANGQLLPLAQNQALFSILGNTYGGSFPVNFALPDLRGRMVVGTGQGPELSNRTLGQQGGAEQIALTEAQLPSHTHGVLASGDVPTSSDPGGNVWAENPRSLLYDPAAVIVDMSPSAIGITGGGQPHPNLMPFQTLHPIICTEGVFPSGQQ